MRKVYRDYKDKVLNELNASYDLDSIKSKLKFNSSENVYKKTPKQKILSIFKNK